MRARGTIRRRQVSALVAAAVVAGVPVSAAGQSETRETQHFPRVRIVDEALIERVPDDAPTLVILSEQVKERMARTARMAGSMQDVCPGAFVPPGPQGCDLAEGKAVVYRAVDRRLQRLHNRDVRRFTTKCPNITEILRCSFRFS